MTTPARINFEDLGHMLWVPIGMAVIMVVAALWLGEPIFSAPFTGIAAVAFGLRFVLRSIPAQKNHAFTTGETMATSALAWLMIAILVAIPFWASPWLAAPRHNVEMFTTPLNGLFEAVSGITSTGLTMVDKPSDLPATLQFWRSLTEWIGGVGIALLMITLMNPRIDGGDLFGSELNKDFHDNAHKTARWIWQIYGVLTVIAIGLFWLFGMPWWESLNHGLTATATGGFSVTDHSFGDYSQALQVVAMVIMVLSAISFAGYHAAIERRNPLVLLECGPVAFLLGGLFAATGLVWLSRPEFETDGGFYVALFQSVSAFTTAGFSTVALSDWHSAPLALLVTCMLIGGASGATTGGVKTDRVLLLCRGIGWRIQRLFRAEIGRSIEIDGKAYSMQDARLQVEGAATLVTLWLASTLVGCLLLAPVCGDDWTFTQIGFEVISALGGVGLSTGITTVDLPDAGKWTSMALMWAGRLELMAALGLLWLPFVRSQPCDD